MTLHYMIVKRKRGSPEKKHKKSRIFFYLQQLHKFVLESLSLKLALKTLVAIYRVATSLKKIRSATNNLKQNCYWKLLS